MLVTGEQLKLEGLELAAKKYGPDLVRAKLVAELLGMRGEVITSEDVREGFIEQYQRELKIGNAMGAIFDEKWQSVGYTKAKRPKARARAIQQWQLKEQHRVNRP
jgi:hypothetical protein